MEAVHRRAGGTAAETPSGAEQRTARTRAFLLDAQRFARTYLAPLFDFSYADVSLDRLFAIIQVVATLALAYGCVELTLFGFAASPLRGLALLFLASPAIFVGGLAALRVALVFVLALVRIADHMEGVAGNMEDLGELPRFLRTFSPLRRRAPAVDGRDPLTRT